MTPFAIAGMQLELHHKGQNLPRIRERVDHLMHVFPWVEMVVLSELAACGPILAHAEPLPGHTEHAFQELARRHRIWLVNGSHFERDGSRVYNTTSVIGPDGAVVGRYRKMFPFRPYEEQVEAGEEFLVFDVPGVGRFGVSICYDMWFPETTRALAALGAEVILHPSLTNTIDRDVEVAMARAAAAQNQCFVVDINGAGEMGNGRSVIVGPAGDILYEARSSEELIPFELMLTRVRRSRERGLLGLGQPLKSFRDSRVRFRVYDPEDVAARVYLETLGPLAKPARPERSASDEPAGAAEQEGSMS